MDAIEAIAENNYSIESYYVKVSYEGTEKSSILDLVNTIQDRHYNVTQIDIVGDRVDAILFKIERVTKSFRVVIKKQ